MNKETFNREKFSGNTRAEWERRKILRDCYQATLLGGAIGDILGMPVEGWSREQIGKYVGGIEEPLDPVVVADSQGIVIEEDEHGPLMYIAAKAQLRKGEYTDDTLLSIATARAIVDAGGLDLNMLARESVKLFINSRYFRERDPSHNVFGQTTTDAFANLQKGIPPTQSGVMSRYPGNAPVLKMAPVGLYMHATGKYDEGLSFAEQAGRMTHKDPRSIVSGIVQAHAVCALLDGVLKTEFVDGIVAVVKNWEKSEEQGKKVTMLERLQWVADNRDVDEETAYQQMGTGWAVTRNYPFTLFMFQKYWDNPVEGLLKTINYGGDCDSTGAMYGALAGARKGMIFPQAWMNMLKGKRELRTLAKKIYNLRQTA